MGFVELFLIGVGLRMDAFAVSICKGLSMQKLNWRQGGVVALFFGGFQALMPLIGWALGKQFEQYITSIDHWIAFLLLGYIGGKMIWDAFHEEDESCPTRFDLKELFVMAVATSIDALAVGVSFAFLGVRSFSSILPSIGIIGFVSFALSFVGLMFGIRFGCGIARKLRAELWGGVILIIIGTKILIEHLFCS